MAAISAAFVGAAAALGSPAVELPVLQRSSVARFNGLKACPTLRQRGTASRLTVRRRLSITASADEQTLTAVQSIIAKQLAVKLETVLPESKFTDLGADSLDTVEIMMAIEDEFEVSLDEDRAEKVATVQEAADLIQVVIQQRA